MNFKKFLMNEADPMGGGSPMPGAGAAPPPMGGPMGGPGGAPGGDPLGGGIGGGMGGMPQPAALGPQEPPPIPKYADIWDVLDSLLNHKPLEHDKKAKQQASSPPPAPPMPPPMPGMPPSGPPNAPQGPLLMQ